MSSITIGTDGTWLNREITAEVAGGSWLTMPERGGYVFSFGAYGSTRVIVVGHSALDNALEVAADTLAEIAPGVFEAPEYEPTDCLDRIAGPYCDGVHNGCAVCTEACENAEVDMTYTEAGWLPSWVWSVRDATEEETAAAIVASLSVGDCAALLEGCAWIQSDDDPDTDGECETETDVGTLICCADGSVWTQRYGYKDMQLR